MEYVKTHAIERNRMVWPGAIEYMIPEITRRAYQKALIVTDSGLVNCGVVRSVTRLLEATLYCQAFHGQALAKGER